MNLSPTPSEENLRNVLHASTCDALESFVKKEEESYDGFMSGFLYLRKEDVVQWEDKRRTKAADGTSEKLQKPTGSQQNEEKHVDSLPADEQLEQEVLNEGSTTSRLEERQVIKTGTKVKFDNFVVNEEEEEEEEEDFKTRNEGLSDLLGNSTGYTASFDHFTDPSNTILTRISDNSGTFHNKELEESELRGPEEEFEIITEEYSTNFGPQGDTINPGEVEDTNVDPTLQDLQNITQLDFAATYRTERFQHDADTQDQTEQCSNEVIPFTLDEDFDYDNVTLTPKYTFAEMKQLEELLRGMQARTEV
ncbi:hypothetical protein CHS0354_011535 [Potamilus streckersoni]|uniref:Uncharacterized protein n=1 Tax=Potamilus streckersoni TaxID=2493646 RepID=A0AAE0SL14_9BIVA|nr:hypothetical protein CHS0354_011535 [Potamilus streckersoni]